MNPYESSTVQPQAVPIRKALYIPAFLCWFGTFLFAAIFFSLNRVIFGVTPTNGEIPTWIGIVLIMNAAMIGGMTATFLAGFRSLRGKWKSSLIISILSFAVLYIVAMGVVAYVRHNFPPGIKTFAHHVTDEQRAEWAFRES